jgi:DNA-binding LacI/PurR family transcriptional regulator
LSVAGFDNDPASQWLIPELTTVSQPFSYMGDTAMALLRDLLAGKPWDGRDRILPVQFIPRKSTQSIETVQPASR